MLSPKVYKELYRYASEVAHGNILEIGAAHGASTIAMALGMRESQYNNTIVTFEKGEGGSRVKYGSKEENLRILQDNLETYDVDEIVELVPEKLDEESGVPEIVHRYAPYSMLCIDADGELHRDFSLLYDLLEPGAVIVIDDYSFKRDYREQSKRRPLGGKELPHVLLRQSLFRNRDFK